MALYMDVGPEDVLRVGPDTYITIERKSGSRARMRIVGGADIELRRNAKNAIPTPPAPVNQKEEE